MGFLEWLGLDDFPARWRCGLWSELHGWTHIASDVVIGLAYLVIPVALLLVVRRRRDVPFGAVLYWFSAFIVSCGTVHLLEALIFWVPVYRLSAIVKVCTAVVSVGTVLVLLPQLPRALKLPSLEREVEERRRAEERLREVAEIVESASDAMLLAGTVSPDASWGVRRWNTSAERLLGYTEEEARVLGLGDLSVEAVQPSEERLSELVERGKAHDVSTRVRSSSGGEIEVFVTIFPVGDGLALILRDRRPTLRVEEAKQNLISIVSHELRTPLTAISGALKLLGADSSPEHLERMRSLAERNTLRLQRLVSDLLDVQRLDADMLPIEPQASDLEELCAQVVRDLWVKDEEQPFLEVEEGLHATLDPDRMGQVLVNLLSNAKRYSAVSGIGVRAWAESGTLHLEVLDRGPGVATWEVAKLFGRFQQVGRERARGGTGLGLMICKGIVELHRGKIEYRARPGGGSVFAVTLPQHVS